ncbi:hypothetical protein GCM10022198_10850 [Klugiella xanthotipulae]|uniref:Lycopene cyclase domain-containing protein n=1 Tax=Klugiella xanthotipulae TaxID=244735 RepID=A0A543HYX7_9MICO|nr:lycopene cyclase domain-containing protein [Klugiella xanthotipulae]TQM63480.1 lycopene cyclase domain-containing protein [Klugiella xanthotipulae]
MPGVYLALLLITLGCMVILDWRYRLFFWRGPVRAAATLILGVVFLGVWDALGIGLGIFFRGDSPLLAGLTLAPEFPVEEVFFLVLLCYLTMNLYVAATRLLSRRGGVGGDGGNPS